MVVCLFTGQTNVTKTPSPPQRFVECACTGCEESLGSCKGAFGCFTLLKPNDEKTGYYVTKGCIENAFSKMATCENAHHPVYCCEEHMCNWNVTPPFPTTQPGMCKLFILLQLLSREIFLVKLCYFLLLLEHIKSLLRRDCLAGSILD